MVGASATRETGVRLPGVNSLLLRLIAQRKSPGLRNRLRGFESLSGDYLIGTMSEAEFERGKREGVVDATLKDHGVHLSRINGNIDRFALALEALAERLTAAVDRLSAEVRTLQEQGRSAALAVKVAADTLALETERRREELAASAAVTQGTWSLRANKVSVGVLIVAVVAVAVSIFFGFR